MAVMLFPQSSCRAMNPGVMVFRWVQHEAASERVALVATGAPSWCRPPCARGQEAAIPGQPVTVVAVHPVSQIACPAASSHGGLTESGSLFPHGQERPVRVPPEDDAFDTGADIGANTAPPPHL